MVRDERWFEEIYRRHRSDVLAFCTRRAGAVDAGDLANQVFTVAWRRRADVPEDRELPWLYGVARRVVGHHWRSRGRARRLAERAVIAEPRPPTTSDEERFIERQIVRDALSRLRPADREVLMLEAWEGLTHAEIADVLGASVAAVDKRASRAKARLGAQYRALESRIAIDQAPARAPKGGGVA